MAQMRKRFSSVCSSSSAEDDSADLYDSVPDPAAEQDHPYAALLCVHQVQDSLLSSNSRFTAYRGILNWIIILLVLTHAHLFLENFIQHGFLIDVKKVLEHLLEENCNWPSVNLILAANVFTVAALLFERFQEKGKLSPVNSRRLHLLNLALLVLFPAAVIVHEPTISTGGALVSLWVYTVLGLKLYSYQETNSWYRQTVSIHADTCSDDSNLTLPDLYYFLVAPTLCYQRHFPRTSTVHINKLLHRTLEMVIVTQIMVGIVQQWIEPIFQRSEMSFTNMDILVRVEHLVGLVAPTHFLVLLFFFLCHSYLNFCAELLRFGDRHFYGDWWNATTLISLWENWNIPFHKWCHRHVYTRLLEKNIPSSQAELLVFLMSAALFEFVFALPLHSCRLWIFIMMLCELFVAVFLGGYFQGNYGNGLVWLCLLLGPPLAVTTYFHDHYVSFHHPSPSSSSSPPGHVFLQLR
ncbi:diacylglycerol O-acyltransferase 1-like [Sphaeramia orbicularis]|uniref:diacylglycerol O-acyltransferase 1-like n=1 Tax=Sphaeramia orbicularis TaxID=375764 RepID=UPI00117EC975|nr:diacylglycerol O-acyltransferase 1-like [Sphaeramia orbicularis]XP_029993205.1 diacylglycerol O-acyltransferase 1-like [Sphaeramia orbicularis]